MTHPHDTDQFRLSLRGALVVSALRYAEAFGTDIREALDWADRRAAELEKLPQYQTLPE